MKLLLDTAAFLWFATNDARLPRKVGAALRAVENDVWLSAVSVWEIALKQGRGKLHLPSPAATYVPFERARHGIEPLALEERAIAHLSKLPGHHQDPFDRILVCQAIEYHLTLVTNDPVVRQYPVKTLWSVGQEEGPV